MVTVSYRGRAAVHVFGSRATLTAFGESLERDHPIRRWVTCMTFYALDVHDGHLPGPYSECEAERFARAVLMPSDEFLVLAGCEDVDLADYFNVPLEQVARRRLELSACRSS